MQVNFLELVEMRASVRHYVQEAMSLKELSFLLWCSQGVKMLLPDGRTIRNVPAAGGAHPLETYLLVRRMEGLEAGVYRFLPFEHALLAQGTDLREAERAFDGADSEMVGESAVTFVWSAVMERMAGGSMADAYRYAAISAGHACQNLYLAAQAIEVGVCAIGTFQQAGLTAALGLEGTSEIALYAAAAGNV